MNLKYVSKNDGYIIDKKFTSFEQMQGEHTYVENGMMTLSEVLPAENVEMEKSITEYAFDNMKDHVLKDIKKKYSVSNEEIYNFYFEGNIEKNSNDKIYAKFKDKEILVQPVNFNLKFEVEVKVTPKNFLKVQYNNLMYRINSI